MAKVPSSLILLIADDPSFTYLMQRYIQRSGCRMVNTKLGEEALAFVHRTQPAVIVLDMAFHRPAGLKMLKDLKSDLITNDIPVIVCSGLEQESRNAEAGADVCLCKPVMYYDFLTALADAGVLSPA